VKQAVVMNFVAVAQYLSQVELLHWDYLNLPLFLVVAIDYWLAKQAVVMNLVVAQDLSQKGLLHLEYPNLPLALVVAIDYWLAK
jgi:hypothetical protein